MKRRSFTQYLALGIPSLAMGSPPFALVPTRSTMKKIKMPRPLKKGDTIGLVAPGSSASAEKIEKAVRNLENLGFNVVFGTHARDQKGYLAGTDEDRLSDLHRFFADDQIDGIWCLRGGYGSARLLPHLDFKLIRKHPKVFIGYSDITVLLEAIFRHSGLVTFHGPVASSTFTDFTVQHLQSVLMNGPARSIPAVEGVTRIISPGKARGQLRGGNLSLIGSLCGSPYQPDFKGRIVFLEDIGEQPYRIDRLLTQLLQSTDLAKAAGIVLGIFEDCEASPGSASLSLMETVQDRLGNLGIPVVYGMPFGHIADMVTLPVGSLASLELGKDAKLNLVT